MPCSGPRGSCLWPHPGAWAAVSEFISLLPFEKEGSFAFVWSMEEILLSPSLRATGSLGGEVGIAALWGLWGEGHSAEAGGWGEGGGSLTSL